MESRPGVRSLAIGAAGFVGALARFGVGRGVQRLFDTSFPIGTLIVNLSGCFILGFFMTLVAGRMVSDTVETLLVRSGLLASGAGVTAVEGREPAAT